MKKFLSVLLSIILVLSFAFFAVGSSSSEDEDVTQKAGKADGEVADNAEGDELGDYGVIIKDARITEDWEGKPVIVVMYNFTNNSEENAAFAWTFSDNAFQNGIGLEKAYMLADGDTYDSANQSKEIQPGASLDVEIAYVLNDSETDVEVEVEELISFDSKTISKTFSIV